MFRLAKLLMKLQTAETKSSELRSCVKVEVDVLGSPSIIVPTVSVDIKQLELETKSCERFPNFILK